MPILVSGPAVIWGPTAMLSNNGLHQTGARGVALFHSSEGQSSLGAPAGEAECWTELGTDRMRLGGSEIRGSWKPLVAGGSETAQRESRRWIGLSTWSRLSGSLLAHRPGTVGKASTVLSPSASLSLARFYRNNRELLHHRDSTAMSERPSNKGMNPTKSSQTDWGLRGLFQC